MLLTDQHHVITHLWVEFASGLTNGKELAEMIAAQSVLWFESTKQPMSVEKMGEFLDKWLE